MIALSPGHFTSGEGVPGTLNVNLGEPRAGLDILENRSSLSLLGNEPPFLGHCVVYTAAVISLQRMIKEGSLEKTAVLWIKLSNILCSIPSGMLTQISVLNIIKSGGLLLWQGCSLTCGTCLF